jgi:Superinfection immunity protein
MYYDYPYYPFHHPGFGLIATLIYFLPAIIAFARHHQSRVAILLVNFFFGWSGLGWIVAFIWSLSAVRYYWFWGPPPSARWHG